ncbi:hypothetical protein U472_09765 [Orenia metallireducens]|uniref:Uncharacterized protein n=1 Tax=Orenia metallireducens TaxID=1413210 RepID=A0A1C0A7U4_9FIRM|nr:hypothetical protein [Orenia metallireducens]OCL26288.1 hypothetical protein U472_09765 [Orenia metallireducens]
MSSNEVAMKITLKAIEHNLVQTEVDMMNPNAQKSNELAAKEVAKFYKTIYKSIEECRNTHYKDINIDSSK